MIQRDMLKLVALGLALSGFAHGAATFKKADGTSVTGELRVVDARGVILRTTSASIAIPRKDLAKAEQERLQSWLDGKAVPPGFEKPAVAQTIKTQSGNLAYDLSDFEAGAGTAVVLTISNEDQLQHNLIVCNVPGADAGQELAFSALLLGGEGMEKEWVPDNKHILAASRMVNPQATSKLYFHAPERADSYAYVCTFPGHSQVMKGLMIVEGGAKDTPEPAGQASTPGQVGLHHVRYAVYKGNWKLLPDWTKLKPVKEGRVKTLCDIKKFGENDQFGVVFTGSFNAPKAGSYTFNLASDDGSCISLDGKTVVNNDGIHGVQGGSGKVTLSAGEHDFLMEFFEGGGGEDLFASWRGPGSKKDVQLTPGKVSGGGRKKGGNVAGIPLFPPAGEAMIYRNFIDGVGGARGIGVGYSEGVHLAYDAENGRIAMIWRGGFIDAKRHWSGRGQGFQPPSGEPMKADPHGQMLASLPSPADAWPQDDFVDKGKSKLYTGPDRTPSAYQFLGYELNAKRHPTFYWTWRDVAVSDFPQPNKEGGFTRTLRFKGKAPATGPLYFRVANADTGLSYRVEGAQAITGDGDTRIPIDLSRGKAEVIVHYTFN